ncbi:MAG: acetyl-CoA carboxylase biotin carboxyl carrier protein [Elusimicrobia bacterium]|nr:acetyl-CoA carboxylase biotin carboxyl carrier protein [Elusimicrobiota bacterium]
MNNSKENSLSNGLKKEISALYEIMRNEKLEELEIEEKDFYVHLKRKGKTVKAVPQAAAAQASPAQQEQTSVTAEIQATGETIQSPIMGVFYRAPSPTLSSFVKEGDIANPGKTVCIVEAMKVMNEIKSESKVKIVKILVENGNPVVAGQDLFVIEKV